MKEAGFSIARRKGWSSTLNKDGVQKDRYCHKWARDTNDELLGWVQEADVFTFYLRKAGPGKE